MKLSKAEKKRRARARKIQSKSYQKKVARGLSRKSLAEWRGEVCEGGRCDVCGVGVKPILNKDGSQKFRRKIVVVNRIIIRVDSKTPVMSKLDAHHLLPKERYPEFKTHTMNGVCLCPMHHKYGRYSAHRNPIWFVLWIKTNRREKYKWAVENMGSFENVD